MTRSVRIRGSFCPSPQPPPRRQSWKRRGCRSPCFVESGLCPRRLWRGAMSQPSGSVAAGRPGIYNLGPSTDLGTRRQEPCSCCDEQGCLRPPSIKRVGRSSTGSGGRSLSRLCPSDRSKSTPVIAKEKARFHGGELKIIGRRKSFKTCRPRLRALTTDDSKLGSMGTRPRRPRARIKLRARRVTRARWGVRSCTDFG